MAGLISSTSFLALSSRCFDISCCDGTVVQPVTVKTRMQKSRKVFRSPVRRTPPCAFVFLPIDLSPFSILHCGFRFIKIWGAGFSEPVSRISVNRVSPLCPVTYIKSYPSAAAGLKPASYRSCPVSFTYSKHLRLSSKFMNAKQSVNPVKSAIGKKTAWNGKIFLS